MWILLTILFAIVCGTTSKNEPCGLQKSVKLENGTYAGLKFLANETITDPDTKEPRGCVCLKEKGKCARKCCPFGQIYKYDTFKCIDPNTTIPIIFDPPVTEEKNKEFIVNKGIHATEEFIFITGKMVCVRDAGERRLPVWPAVQSFNLIRDGKLYVEIPSSIPNVFIYGPDKYCIDTFVSDKDPPHLNALICFVAKPEENSYEVSASCMLISCFFILLTVAVYAWVPELRNLHGMVLMAYLLSFFVGFLFLATMQILILKKHITQEICTILTFIIYYSLLAAFFWLNVMCYDIWWTFSGKRAHGHSGSVHKRFACYAIYAFGVPTLLTIILAALEFSDLPMQHPLLPRLRIQGCFIHGNSKLLYLYGPIILLCVANMTFFGLTAFKIWKIKKETKVLRDKENSATNAQDAKDTQRFTLYVKLFTVMGINWILEVVSSFYPDADFYWQFSDAYNVLVGLIIFIIFVCKKKTWNLIKKRYWKLTGNPKYRRTSITTITTFRKGSSSTSDGEELTSFIYRQMRGDPMSRTQTTTSSRTVSTSRGDELRMNSIKK